VVSLSSERAVGVNGKSVRSTANRRTDVQNANGLLPKGQRLVVGENTTLYL
jgi:hypothetical protein